MLRRLLIHIFLLFVCLTAFGQVNQVLWGKGKALYANPIATIDSLTYGQLLYGDTLYIIFDRQSKRIVYDTIHMHVPGIVFHDTVYTTDTIYLEPSRRIGVFSVAADKQVSFSQGNLQYISSSDTWCFANQQWDYLGEQNRQGERIDLFDWPKDAIGKFFDWGNYIINSDIPNIWRTLSKDEYTYLLHDREHATELMGGAIVEGVSGLVILPDDWVCPPELRFTSLSQLDCTWDKNQKVYQLPPDIHELNNYSVSEWQIMEQVGAVFLPTAGYIDKNAQLLATGTVARYWSSSPHSYTKGYYLSWSFVKDLGHTIRTQSCVNPDLGHSVRLVHDTILPPPEPEYVDLGLSVKWATFNVGATSPEDYGDYYAWGETMPKDIYSWTNYKWCDGTQNNMTKYNATDGKTTLEPADDAATVNWGDDWRMPTKAEMQELFDNCTWAEETRNAVNGYLVTGPNGNSIFLPKAGFYNFDDFGESLQKPNHSLYYWTNTIYDSGSINAWDLVKNGLWNDNRIMYNTRRLGIPIRPVYDDRVTLTVIPTPEDAKVTFLCKGYQAQGHSITVDKGKDVLYQVTNVDAGYLSQGDSIYKLTKDSVLHVTLRPFSDGNWVVVDNSELTKYEDYYISRNRGSFAGPYSNWDYYVLPVMAGETYRVRAAAGQLAPVWFVASTAPDLATKTRPTKVCCSDNKGVVAYVADEVTIPEGAKYLIVNNGRTQVITVERKVPDPCLLVRVNDTLSINLMCVEGGTFRMGVGAENYIERDDPQANQDSTTHLVTLSDYYMAQTAVTQGLWKAVMGTDIRDMVAQSRYPDDTPKVGDRYPMEYVRLKDALAFVDELNKRTGMHFRLPTEAEREYAARGGKRSREYKYPGSNDYTKVASPYGSHVAQKLPNELGIYDLSGCTREMCTDSWQTTYIYDEPVVDPVGPIKNRGNRTMRGGHIDSKARPFTRYPYTPTWCGNSLGFRIILPTETKRRMIHVSNTFFEMCFVEGGTFMMGSDASDAQADEQPVHSVTLSDYYIGQTEVTQHLWQAVMGSGNNPSATKGNNLPVTNITWDEAQTFVERLSELTGLRFRLPTEAEWEYAARGGQKSKGYTYAGSDNADSVAWHIWNTTKLQAVGQLLPNELGIFDMTGNVWEYCSDYYAPYEASAQVNPQGPASSVSGNHVTRGGGWRQNSGFDTSLGYCRVANRAELSPSDIVGLRIVLEPEMHYRYGYTQAHWDAATASWGHGGRGHAPTDQSCIQGTMVHGIRLKVAKAGSLNVYKVPSLLEKTEDNFELVATLTTDSTGVQDFDFAEPFYIAPNEYLVFGKPSEKMPTLRPYYANHLGDEFPIKAKAFAHYVGTNKAKVSTPNASLMVEFY